MLKYHCGNSVANANLKNGGRHMKHTIATLAIFVGLFAVSAAKAQTTQTNCNLYGNTANCTSTTTPSAGDSMANAGKSVGEAGASWGRVIQQRRLNNQAKTNVETRVVYCQQNPDGFVTTDTGIRQNKAIWWKASGSFSCIRSLLRACMTNCWENRIIMFELRLKSDYVSSLSNTSP